MIKQFLIKIPFIVSLYEKHLERKEQKTFLQSITVNKKTVFLIGTPTHGNIGDSAIAISQKEFLIQAGVKENDIVEITLDEFNKYKRYLVKRINKSKRPVFLHGGGNMGNEYLCEELPRREMVAGFKRNKITVFPQTIYYTDNDSGNSEATKSISIYNGKKNLILAARERASFNVMKRLYPNTEVILVPDIVLYTNPDVFNIEFHKRQGVLFVKRADAERKMQDSDWVLLKDYFNGINKKTRITDMDNKAKISAATRNEVVANKLSEFSRSELVITDRLHGLVFAALTGTPCIVFGNYNHKVKGTYDWISYLPYVQYVESVENAIKLIPEMLEKKNCKFNNNPLLPYYDKLMEVVKANV